MKRLFVLLSLLLTACGRPATVESAVTATPTTAPDIAKTGRAASGEPITVAVTAVTSPQGPAVTNDGDNYVLEALSHIPADARRFAFTHWARLHRYNDFNGNSRHAERETRVRFMLQVMKGTQAAAQMDSTYFLFQAQNWGWDSTDLVWEAQADWQSLTESVFLLQFRPDFDFRPFIERLHERGFAAAQHRGVTVYSVPLTQDPDWHYYSHLAHHAVALFPEAKLMVMAPRPEVVQRILDTGQDEGAALLALPPVAGAAAELTGLAAVEMQLGQKTCLSYGARARLRTEEATSETEPVTLTPYELLVAGHRFQNGRQQDTLLFSYADAEQATAEFATRRHILQTGISRRRDATYGRQFALQSAAVDGTTMQFRLSPTAALRRSSGWPQTLLGWIQDNDALFAGCTG
jgi:hypothetical protein